MTHPAATPRPPGPGSGGHTADWGHDLPPTQEARPGTGGGPLVVNSPAATGTVAAMTDPQLKVFAKSAAEKLVAPPVHPGPAQLNLNMAGQMRPPTPPGLSKQDGENAMQALQRHIDDHDQHLNALHSDYGLHVPRGTATIMKGLPGSGKSHYLKNHHLGHGTHIHVDVDALKHLATGEHDFKYPTHYPDSHPTHGGKPHPLAGQRITDHYDERAAKPPTLC